MSSAMVEPGRGRTREREAIECGSFFFSRRLNIQVPWACSHYANDCPLTGFPAVIDRKAPYKSLRPYWTRVYGPVPSPSISREQAWRVSNAAFWQSWVNGMPVLLVFSLPFPPSLLNNEIITTASLGPGLSVRTTLSPTLSFHFPL